jgi:hypothetical protein
MQPQFPPPIYDQTGRVNGAEIVFLDVNAAVSHVMPSDTLRAARSCFGSAQSPAAQRHESLVDLPSSRQNRLPAVIFLNSDRFKYINDSLNMQLATSFLLAICHRRPPTEES